MIGFLEFVVKGGHVVHIHPLDIFVEDEPEVGVSLENQFEKVLLRSTDNIRISGWLVSPVSTSRTTPVATHRDSLRPENIFDALLCHLYYFIKLAKTTQITSYRGKL